MSETKSCRHVKSATLPATTTLRHQSIVGRSHAELDITTELCAICSGAIVSMLLLLEAEDDTAYKQTLSAALAAVREASTK